MVSLVKIVDITRAVVTLTHLNDSLFPKKILGDKTVS